VGGPQNAAPRPAPGGEADGVADSETVDLLVVGGGVNGAGIARDAAGRGLSVVLCERDDLASATSSASTKLVHGGLRYLEHYEFRLVREALIEREVLLRAAPHIIWPLRFVLPHLPGLRPAWMIRIGLFLYDHLGGRELLPGSHGIDLRRHAAGAPLVERLDKGFVYSDCWVDDARLVVLNACDAAERGATVRTRTELVSARVEDGLWTARLRDRIGMREYDVRARALVNAAGPWAGTLLSQRIEASRQQALRLVKGSHIVVPRLFDHDDAYIFQQPDRRVVFAIPYEGRFTLVGTTDVDYTGDPAAAQIEDDEIGYLCEAINRYFRHKIAPADVVWSYAGVRPLYDDAAESASEATRDYVLDLQTAPAPLLNVFGGKITTFRKLAEHAVQKLQPLLGNTAADWTARAALPGGDIPGADFAGFARDFAQAHAWLPADLAQRYARAYGTRAAQVVGAARGLDGLGAALGDGIYEAELDYLRRREWAVNVEDVLYRRSKLALHIAPATREAVQRWLADHGAAADSTAAAQ
jgi:glycerol-3-phosphate dehydrogenase